MRLRTAEALLSEAGLPPISSEDPPLSFFEFWPFWAFYTPLWPYLLWLMLRYRGITLPCSANPSFALGGLVGESKAQILEWLEKHLGPWVAPSISRMRSLEPVARQVAQAQQALSDKGLALPVVAKPDPRWGALGKVKQLDQHYPRLREERVPAATATIGGNVTVLASACSSSIISSQRPQPSRETTVRRRWAGSWPGWSARPTSGR